MKHLLIVLLSVPFFLFSQEETIVEPGGVSGSKVWLKPYVFSSDDKRVWGFKDFTLNQNNVTHLNPNLFIKKEMNFNPTIEFTENSETNAVVTLPYDINSGTLIGVYRSNSPREEKEILALAKGNEKEITITTDKIKKTNGEDDLDYGSDQGEDLLEEEESSNLPKLVSYSRHQTKKYSIWGESSNDKLIIADNSTIPFKGHISELVGFSRKLTKLERLKVEGYLAIKYGVHLEDDYLNSQGEVLWKKEDNSFHNRVTGIGRDDASGLLQNKSTSQYDRPRDLLVNGKEEYQDLEELGCEDCIVFDKILEGIGEDGDIIKRTYNVWWWSSENEAWGHSGFNSLVPLKDTDYVTFKFDIREAKSSIVGLSYQETDIKHETIGFGIKKTNNNKLELCKEGDCFDTGLKYTGQLMKILITDNRIAFYADGQLLGEETFDEQLALFLDGSIRQLHARVESLRVHKLHRSRDLADKEFYLWGDNGSDLRLNDSSESKVKIAGLTELNRVWKLNRALGESKSEVKPFYSKVELSRALTGLGNIDKEKYTFWLIQDKGNDSSFKSGDIKLNPGILNDDNKLVFNSLQWDEDESGVDAFTFGYSKENEFLVKIDSENPDCSNANGKISLKDLLSDSREYDYRIERISGTIESEGVFRGQKTVFLNKGIYSISIDDNKGVVKKEKIELVEPTIELKLPEKVELAPGEGEGAEVTLDAFESTHPSELSYYWEGPGVTGTTTASVVVSNSGRYRVTTNKGKGICEKTSEVLVRKTNIKSIEIGPSIPIPEGTNMAIRVKLHSPETVKIYITDIRGQQYVLNSNYDSYTHDFTKLMSLRGIYFINVVTPTSSYNQTVNVF